MEQQASHLQQQQQQQSDIAGSGEDCSLAHKPSHLGVYIKKSNKPLMEKRRRERINTCLDQLKAILMDVTKKESSYYSKLEKADILEMTVKYLHSLRHQRVAGAKLTVDDEAYKYVAGYNECAAQLAHFLTSLQNTGDVCMTTNDSRVSAPTTNDARCCLLEHLANSLGRATTTAGTAADAVTFDTPAVESSATLTVTSPSSHSEVDRLTNSSFPPPTVYVISPQQVPVTSSTDHAHTSPQLRLLPARLSSGELVLLLAGSPAAKFQNGPSRTEQMKPEVTDAKNGCDVISTTELCVATSCCSSDVTPGPCKSDRKSASVGSDSDVSDDASMWRPW